MSTRRPRVIPRAQASSCDVWELPEVDGPVITGIAREPCSPPTAKELEDLQRQAYEEGFRLGREEGRVAGYREAQAQFEALSRPRLETLSGLLRALARPLEQLDEEVVRSLLELTVLVAKQIVRRELKTGPGEIVAVVREALGQLPVASRNPRIYLNPEDVPTVREALALGAAQENYRIEEDPLVARGGCLIETATSFIDATVEARISAVAARLFGDERAAGRE